MLWHFNSTSALLHYLLPLVACYGKESEGPIGQGTKKEEVRALVWAQADGWPEVEEDYVGDEEALHIGQLVLVPGHEWKIMEGSGRAMVGTRLEAVFPIAEGLDTSLYGSSSDGTGSDALVLHQDICYLVILCYDVNCFHLVRQYKGDLSGYSPLLELFPEL
ncbi:hypothetical protein EI94DRAFT_1703426 [Lactarius quietus]|nr:hypothetical protein EI94DRAFT_1703426 [Lactarius quietus]